MTDQPCQKPCSGCPWSRKAEPGYLGGSPPQTYIGQAHGPFLLPCHMDKNYDEDRRSPECRQCIGAAIFRANVGVAELMPSFLAREPQNTELVFATPAEFLSHHAEISLPEASRYMKRYPVDLMLSVELTRSGARQVAVPGSSQKGARYEQDKEGSDR